MSFDTSRKLLFFPTPYPDEILYSVLCRYHLRCGNPSAPQTNIELWGKRYGKTLFLPDGIAHFTRKIPESSGITAEQIISENTILPWLKPFMSDVRGKQLIDALTNGSRKIYNMTGFARSNAFSIPYLRYCPQCADEDMEKYAETYWHRVHQLPDIIVCPKHQTVLIDSQYRTNELKHGFYNAFSATRNIEQVFGDADLSKGAALASDAAWILQNGMNLGGLEHTKELYDGWLPSKGYSLLNGTTAAKKLGTDIVDLSHNFKNEHKNQE